MADESSRCNYSSARLRQFHMHLHNVYFKAYTYPGVRTRLPVQDWERENSWAINAVGMSLIILARWKEGKKEGSLPPWFLFDANPVNHSLVYQRSLLSFLFSMFFIYFHFVLYLTIAFQIYKMFFNSMTAQDLLSIRIFSLKFLQFYRTFITILVEEK